MCLLSGPWRQAELGPLPLCFPCRCQGSGRPDSACLGVGNLVWQGRDSGSQRPLWQRPACACPTCPHHLPQEHKAEVKASMTASFPAVGAAGARALTHGTWHGSSAQTQGHAHQLGRTGHMEPGPHPQLAVCLSVCPPVCHNPEQPQCWVPVGQGWTPCRRISLAKPKASSRSLKGSGLGAARQQALGPEDSQGPRPLCPSLGHSDPSVRGVGGGWPGDHLGCPLKASTRGSWGTDTSCSQRPLARLRPGDQISGWTGGG